MADPASPPPAVGAKQRRPRVHLAALIVVSSAALFAWAAHEDGCPPWTRTVWVLETGGLHERSVRLAPDGPAIRGASVSGVDATNGAIIVYRVFPPDHPLGEWVERAWKGPCGCSPPVKTRIYAPTGVTKPATGDSLWREFRLQP